MTNRITDSHLRVAVNLLNRETGSPMEPYTTVDGRAVANVGNYHISGAYGGVSLHRMVNESGGASDVFSCGHVNKRDLYDRIYAYRLGIESAKVEA